MKTLKQIFSFAGRMNRATYCFVMTIATSLPVLPLYFFGSDCWSYDAVQWVVSTIMITPCTLALIAANTQRLHDLDKTGWLQLVFVANFSISIAILIAMPILFQAQLLWVALALNILALPIAAGAVWLMVELFCSNGTPEPNRFGSPRSFRDLILQVQSPQIAPFYPV